MFFTSSCNYRSIHVMPCLFLFVGLRECNVDGAVVVKRAHVLDLKLLHNRLEAYRKVNVL